MADTNNYLTSIGVEIKVNNVVVAGAIECDDLGASPEMLDATKLSDKVKVNKPGVQDQGAWAITYLFNNNLTTSDFRTLQALADAGESVAVNVKFPDGTTFVNSGIPTNYATGVTVNSMLQAKCEFALDGEWTPTNPQA